MFAEKIRFLQSVYSDSEDFRDLLESEGLVPACDLPGVYISKGAILVLADSNSSEGYYKNEEVEAFVDFTFDAERYLSWKDKKVFEECVEDKTQVASTEEVEFGGDEDEVYGDEEGGEDEVRLYLCKTCLKVTCVVSLLITVSKEVIYFLDKDGEVDSYEEGEVDSYEEGNAGGDTDTHGDQCVMCGADELVKLHITKGDLLALPQDIKDALGVGALDERGLELAKFIELVNTKVKLLNMDVAELVSLLV